jgi:acetyltransferase-like isoleucine patch superfamily enzyme
MLGVALDRARALVLRLRGCQIGPKGRVGVRTRIDRPSRVRVGARAVFESDVWLKVTAGTAQVVVGEFVFFGRGVEIDVSESVSIGNHVLLAPGVFITDHSHNFAAGTLIDAQGCAARPVVIEDDAWLGVRSVVLPGVCIGRGAIVGAGAVVTSDVAPNAIVAGVPARVVGHRA